LTIAYRLANQGDLHFAAWSWLAAHRDDNSAGLLRFSRWADTMLPEFEWMLRRPHTEVHVAFDTTLPPDKDVRSWLAVRRQRPVRSRRNVGGMPSGYTTRPLVLFCYTKAPFRGFGFARALFDRAGIDPWEGGYDFLCKTETLLRPDAATASLPPERRRSIIRRMRRATWTPLALRRDDDDEWQAQRRTASAGGSRDRNGAGGDADPED